MLNTTPTPSLLIKVIKTSLSHECKCYDWEINKIRMKSYSIYGCLYIFLHCSAIFAAIKRV